MIFGSQRGGNGDFQDFSSRKNEKTPGVIYEDIFPAEGNSIPVDIDIHVDTHCPNEPHKKTDLQKHQTLIDEISVFAS